MAEEQKSPMMGKMERFFNFYFIPFVVGCIMYSIGVFWAVIVIYRMARRYHKDPRKVFTVKKRPLPPDVLNAPEFGNHKYIQLPNVKLHYVESGDKTKPLMLLLHGFPEFWYSWRHQIKEFSKDYWVVAVDMRGYGDSDKPPSIKYYAIKYLTEDVKNLIEGLGKEKAILVAHDWGGIVAWNTILQHPTMIEKFVVLNAPHPLAFSRHLTSNFGQFLRSWYMFFFQLPLLPEMFMRADDLSVFQQFFKSKKHKTVLKDDDIEAYKYTFTKPGAFFGPLAYYRANVMKRFRSTKRIEKPTASELPKGFLLFGDDDIAIDTKLVDLSKSYYPNLITETVPGACHFVQEDEPAIVNAKIREFLTALK